MFVDERANIVRLRWAFWSRRGRRRSTLYLQISRWQYGADSSIILKFIVLRAEMVHLHEKSLTDSNIVSQTMNKQERAFSGVSLACLKIRSKNEEAINSTRNRIYSLKYFCFLLYRRRYFLLFSESIKFAS